jgi:hypothetical protein
MRRVIYTSIVLAASGLLGLDMLNQAAISPGDPVLRITLTLMSLGLCPIAYGLYLERHNALAYVLRRRKIRKRAAPRAVQYKFGPAPRLKLPAPSAG